MYKVLGLTATRTFRVLWMMEELGLEYEHLNFAPGSDEMKQINPSGKVPALVEGDHVVFDSTAITQYLADKHGGLTYKSGTIERAKQDSFTQFINDEIDAALWTAARNLFVLPENKRVPEIKETLKWEFTRSLKTLEGRLGDNEFLMGDMMTVPDIILTQCGGWAKVSKFEIPEGKLRDYFKRMVSRPAYKRADALRS